MTETPLPVEEVSDYEREAHDFAHRHLALPWRALVARLSRLEAGESLREDEARFEVIGWPRPLSAHRFHRAMRSGSCRRLFGPNPTRLLVVLNHKRTRVLHVLADRNENGVFVEHVSLRSRKEEPWAGELLRFIREGRPELAQRLATDWLPEQPETRDWKLGLLIVTNWDCFMLLKKAWDKAGDGKITALPFWLMEALVKMEQSGALQIEPPVPVERLRRRLTPLLRLLLPSIRLSGYAARLWPL